MNLKTQRVASEGAVTGRIELGEFRAGRLRADLGQRTVVLDGGIRSENRPGGSQMSAMRRLPLSLHRSRWASRRLRSLRSARPISALRGHDADAPVDVQADRLELQERADRAIFVGNVLVRQAQLTLATERLTVAYSSAGGIDIERLDASGGVVVRSRRDSARQFPDLRPAAQADHGGRRRRADPGRFAGQRAAAGDRPQQRPRGDRSWRAGRRRQQRRPGYRPFHRAPAQRQLSGMNRAAVLERPRADEVETRR